MNIGELQVNGRVVGSADESTVGDPLPARLSLRVFDFDPAAFQAAQQESLSDGIKPMNFQLGDRSWKGDVDEWDGSGEPVTLEITVHPD